MTDKLTLIVKESGLEPTKAEVLLSKFGGYFNEAKELVKVARTIEVTSVEDTKGMAEARKIRRELQDIRTKGVEPTRKSLKEQSLREGRAIDGIANLIKALIVPEEEKLMAKEKYAERIKEEQELKIERDRHDKLVKYVDDIEVYRLHPNDLKEDAFERLLINSKTAYEAQKKAEEQAEKERIEKEKKIETLRNRQMILAPLSDFIDTSKLNIETSQTEYESMVSQAKQSKSAYDDKQEEIRKENEKLQKQKETAEKAKKEAEDKLRKQKELEEKKQLEEKQRIENQKRLEEEEKRKALLAPDKEKLLNFSNRIDTFIDATAPALESKKAQIILNEAESLLKDAIEILRTGAKEL